MRIRNKTVGRYHDDLNTSNNEEVEQFKSVSLPEDMKEQQTIKWSPEEYRITEIDTKKGILKFSKVEDIG